MDLNHLIFSIFYGLIIGLPLFGVFIMPTIDRYLKSRKRIKEFKDHETICHGDGSVSIRMKSETADSGESEVKHDES